MKSKSEVAALLDIQFKLEDEVKLAKKTVRQLLRKADRAIRNHKISSMKAVEISVDCQNQADRLQSEIFSKRLRMGMIEKELRHIVST